MEFPAQFSGGALDRASSRPATFPSFDARQYLHPRRLTMLMWDQAFLLRHGQGQSFEDYDRVLDETIERGYNTVRLDPMPQWLDLGQPDQVLSWQQAAKYMPWGWNAPVSGPVGRWLIDFMAKLRRRDLHYTLSSWWFTDKTGPRLLCSPENHLQAAEVWAAFLKQWEARFGFDNLVYVDIHNEIPFFLPGYKTRFTEATGHGWDELPRFTEEQRQYLATDLNAAMRLLHREFPQLRFTGSIHGDVRWLDVPLEFDCLDVHFYSDADLRWRERTKMHDHFGHMMTDDGWFKDFSDRCMAAHRAVAPMLRARQRDKLSQFAAWAESRGMPLTTSESWSSWFYVDHPDMDWAWLLDWSAWSVDDAIDYRMWGWTPHNYGQPQFQNWKDVSWHQTLTDRFLKS